jgi:hypothetical protein
MLPTDLISISHEHPKKLTVFMGSGFEGIVYWEK